MGFRAAQRRAGAPSPQDEGVRSLVPLAVVSFHGSTARFGHPPGGEGHPGYVDGQRGVQAHMAGALWASGRIILRPVFQAACASTGAVSTVGVPAP